LERSKEKYEFFDNYPVILSNIQEYVHDYLDEHPAIKGFVLGISGGVDSAVSGALAKRIAMDRPGFKVIGRAISIVSNKPEEVKRGVEIGKHFCSDFDSVALDHLFRSVYTGLRHRPAMTLVGHENKKEAIQQGNIKARLRMLLLYDLAHREDCIVLSTDNLTELLLGFWTLHGDVGDLGMIQGLFKTEVYGLAYYLARDAEKDMNTKAGEALRSCATAIPTDGLGVSNSDLDQLLPNWERICGDPISGYRRVDEILIDYLNGGLRTWDENELSVIERHEATHHKRNNPINIPREVLLQC
jgi:NAD+ synthetase